MAVRSRDDVVLLSEFARIAGVSRMTVYIWARAGEIPAHFVAGRYELSRRELPAILLRLRERGRGKGHAALQPLAAEGSAPAPSAGATQDFTAPAV